MGNPQRLSPPIRANRQIPTFLLLHLLLLRRRRLTSSPSVPLFMSIYIRKLTHFAVRSAQQVFFSLPLLCTSTSRSQSHFYCKLIHEGVIKCTTLQSSTFSMRQSKQRN